MSLSPFFKAENFLKKLIVSAVTVRNIHGREVVSFYKVVSLEAYKYFFPGNLRTRFFRKTIFVVCFLIISGTV